MKSIKEKSGITLITLAVTIVVILILAGVTIDVTLGENGILNKSKEAANRMNNLVKEDETELNELLNELNATMDLNWNSNIEIPGGNEITNTEPTPPEPENPKLENTTGIQTENTKVEDKFGNVVTIPKGFEVVEQEGTTVPEGIVVQDKDGNQFVWIPVGRVYKDATKNNYSDIQLGRYTFNTTNGTPTLVQAAYTDSNPENYKQLIVVIEEYYGSDCFEYTTRVNPDGIESAGTNALNAIAKNLGAFINSVKNNNGYYLARYEASYGSGTSVANYKPLSKISTSVNDINELNMKYIIGHLWVSTGQIDAAKICRNMYNNDESVGVESDLANSYAYDTAIVFIQKMGNSNYANKAVENRVFMNTGTTGDEVCNIFDMASNHREWSTEYSSYQDKYDGLPYLVRGGFAYSGTTYTAMRSPYHQSGIQRYVSFRPVVYIK